MWALKLMVSGVPAEVGVGASAGRGEGEMARAGDDSRTPSQTSTPSRAVRQNAAKVRTGLLGRDMDRMEMIGETEGDSTAKGIVIPYSIRGREGLFNISLKTRVHSRLNLQKSGAEIPIRPLASPPTPDIELRPHFPCPNPHPPRPAKPTSISSPAKPA